MGLLRLFYAKYVFIGSIFISFALSHGMHKKLNLDTNTNQADFRKSSNGKSSGNNSRRERDQKNSFFDQIS